MGFKKFKKFVNFLSRLEDMLILIICLLFFLIGLYGVYDSYLVYQSANDDSILKYKPGYESEEEADKQIKGNMVAWLSVKNTSIDYPVMQGETNNDYLNTDPFGEYSLSGSIFLDYRNNEDFEDSYSLIYGHHMDGGYMFGALDSFMKEDYFKKHQKGSLIVDEVEYEIQFFSALEIDATNDYIFAPTTRTTTEMLEFIKSVSVLYDENVVSENISDNDTENIKLIALSTCKSPNTIERTVVVGFLKK